MRSFIFFVLFMPLISQANENKLSIFNNLVDKTWKAEGVWKNGKKFKQEKTFTYSLNSTVVIANTRGFIDQDLTKFADRNLGIRQYDIKSGVIKFWEFDFKGNLTSGVVFNKGNNLFYQYDYQGIKLTNMWEFVNANTYNFKVGVWEKGKYKKLFLDTQFISDK